MGSRTCKLAFTHLRSIRELNDEPYSEQAIADWPFNGPRSGNFLQEIVTPTYLAEYFHHAQVNAIWTDKYKLTIENTGKDDAVMQVYSLDYTIQTALLSDANCTKIVQRKGHIQKFEQNICVA